MIEFLALPLEARNIIPNPIMVITSVDVSGMGDAGGGIKIGGSEIGPGLAITGPGGWESGGPRESEPGGPRESEPGGPREAEPGGPREAEPGGPRESRPGVSIGAGGWSVRAVVQNAKVSTHG